MAEDVCALDTIDEELVFADEWASFWFLVVADQDSFGQESLRFGTGLPSMRA